MQGKRKVAKRDASGALTQDEARLWARAGILAAFALVLSYAETFIPLPLPVPGAKLGLANIAVLVALKATNASCASAVALVKTLAAGLLFGSPVMIPFSAAGTLLAFAAMFVLVRVPGLHLVMVSVCGAVCHVAGQLAVASLMLGTLLVWYTFPLLMVVACVTGVLTGKVAVFLLESLDVPDGIGEGEERRGGWNGEGGEYDGGCGDGCGNERGKHGEHEGSMPLLAPSHPTSFADAPFTEGSRGGTSSHRLARRVDARVLLLVLLVYAIVVFCVQSPIALGVCALIALASAFAAKMRPRDAVKALVPLSSILVITAIAQIACNQQGTAIVYVGPVVITQEALATVAFMFVRLLCIMVTGAAFARMVSADELASALTSMLGVFGRLGVRTRGVELALDLALRFVPVLVEEFNSLKAEYAQADPMFSGAGPLAKLRAYQKMLAPLAAHTFAYADQEADRIAACAH